jgi:Uma2 family endonuclease
VMGDHCEEEPMTAAPTLPERQEWTVEDLGELPRDLRYELINGRLIVPSPVPAHQDLAFEIGFALRAACPPDFLVSTDQSLRINRRNEPRPDLVGIRIEHYGRTPVPVEDAVLAVELVSEHSEFRDMVEKARVYAEAGMPAYWVVDQNRPEISLTEMVLGPSKRSYEITNHTTGVFSVDAPWPITIDLPQLSARRAAILERIRLR